MKNSGLLNERNLWLLKRKIEIFMYASYFNHKSHGEEMLIEQYRIQLSMNQQNPKLPMVTQIQSKDIFNLNLTYGCILSLIKVLQFIKDNERVKDD
jgi:hypothetical protein